MTKAKAVRSKTPGAKTAAAKIARAKTALLFIDFINLFDFHHGAQLGARAVPAARKAARLKQKAASRGIPAIYVNDNFKDWSRSFDHLVDECMKRGGHAAQVADILRPEKDDISILKPRHSAFYGTPLDFLLQELGATHLILTGIAADNCVFATAQDAHVRQFTLWIPGDCVASETRRYETEVLEHMQRTLKAKISPSTSSNGFAGTKRSKA